MKTRKYFCKGVYITLAMTLWLLSFSATAGASFIYVGDYRTISGNTTIHKIGTSDTIDDSFSNQPSSAFADFSADDSAESIFDKDLVTAAATQTSSLTPTLFTAEGRASASVYVDDSTMND